MKYSLVKKYKFKLEDDYAIDISIDFDCHNSFVSLDKQRLILRHSYLWDGSSIPLKRFVPKKVYDFDKYCKEASLVHDGLCQLMREGLLPKRYKKEVDNLYRYMAIQGGLSKRNANRRYKYMRKYGDRYIEKKEHPRNEIFDT